MTKKTELGTTPKARISKILVAQNKPEGTKSPYFDLQEKRGVKIDFMPFIKVEGIPARDFRKQKIDINSYSAIIFTSRNAIDHFFRICEEMKITVSQDIKYFCITEAVALYLQRFILYRKRRVFYGADGSNKSLFDVINRHKSNEKFLYPVSDTYDSEIAKWLENNKCEFAKPSFYRIVSNDISESLHKNYDIICLFTPGAVKAIYDNEPGYTQNETVIAAHGANTHKAAEEAGLKLNIKVGLPNSPSMVGALEKFIEETKALSRKKSS